MKSKDEGIRTYDAVSTRENGQVDELQAVSARLLGLADQHPPVTEALLTLSGNVQNTATVLAVVAAIKCPKPN
jgi:hypothetical protein